MAHQYIGHFNKPFGQAASRHELTGHHHKLVVAKAVKLQDDPEARTHLAAKYSHLVAGGSWLNGFVPGEVSYAEAGMMVPLAMGGAVISVQKRKRGFFNESVGTWLAARDGEVVDRVLLSDSPAYEQVVDRGVVEQAVSSWRGGNVRQAPLLLSLVMLELWMGDYLPRAFALADGPVRSAA